MWRLYQWSARRTGSAANKGQTKWNVLNSVKCWPTNKMYPHLQIFDISQKTIASEFTILSTIKDACWFSWRSNSCKSIFMFIVFPLKSCLKYYNPWGILIQCIRHYIHHPFLIHTLKHLLNTLVLDLLPWSYISCSVALIQIQIENVFVSSRSQLSENE